MRNAKDPNSPTQVLPPDPVVAKEICDRVAAGETLLKIIDVKPRPAHYPCRQTFYEWLRNDPQIAMMYEKARIAGYDVMAEKCLELAHEEIDKPVDGKRDPAHIAHQKLKIDTYSRLLGKWAPKKYGDKVEVSGNAEQPIAVSVENKIPVADIVAALREAKRKAAE
jgi:hypothetical protein